MEGASSWNAITLAHSSCFDVDTSTILKRAANAIFEHGGIIRKIENLGSRPTPFKISSHGQVHKEASYFVYTFDFPPAKLSVLNEVLARDVDVIRKRIFRVTPEEPVDCMLEEEIKPAPYRYFNLSSQNY
ncbi:28S ribosomal protein S6, mitochondrial [Homalodisca vitripennis]|nr:28S ribosomal protein S6, mitochondrial [Homalodisca vitripennis]